jgi:hypothetical protein
MLITSILVGKWATVFDCVVPLILGRLLHPPSHQQPRRRLTSA